MWRKLSFLIAAVLVWGLVDSAGAGVVIMQCDVGGCGPLQSGWIGLGGCGTSIDVGGTGIDVTLATGNPGACECRNEGGSGPLADVETDLLFANDEESSPGSDFIITFSNLMPGMTYRLLSYHNRSDEGDTTIPNVTITGATVVSVPASIVQNHAIMDNPAECIFIAGAGDVSIRFQGPDGGCAGCQAFLNGFVLEYAGPTISFDSESSGGIESISPAFIQVNLTNPVGGATYSVSSAVTGGTAEGSGVDYTLDPNTFTFNPGETSKTISVDIIQDGFIEEDETIIVDLFEPTGPDVMLGISQHTYTISDLAPKVSFDSATSIGLESSTPANIKVKLSHASDQIVTVNYAVAGGTATGGGVDYTLLGDGTLTFGPCDVTEYISISIVDDAITETQETIQLALSDPCNATLGTPAQHTYSILDNEQGVYFDGLMWYYSDYPNPLTVNPDGQLEWVPEKDEQFITRLSEHPFSSTGDVVEISYWWMSDGEGHESHPECEIGCQRNDEGCPCDYDDDIQCLAGTSDMRVGLFEADGEYITGDGFEVYGSSIFEGYKGYGWRFGPHMDSSPTYWKDCANETHKTGQFQKKPVSLSNLLSTNDGLSSNDDPIPGFELPPGEFSLFTIRLERLSSSSVELSITLNDRTYTWTDDDSDEQPQKIDVLAVTMRNGRPYSILTLGPVCRVTADFDGDNDVDWDDLKTFVGWWANRCIIDDWCGGCDINQDLRVNLGDFAILASEWLKSCP